MPHILATSLGDLDNVILEFRYIPGEKEILYPNDSAYPGSPPEIELISLTYEGVNLLEGITPAEEDELKNEAFTHLNEIMEGI